jgi:Flp pilus assembly protein CpaB
MRRRWSPSSKVFGAVALLLGAGAFLIVRAYEARVEALAPALGQPAKIVVAAAPLPRGTVLSADMLREAVYPSRYAPPGALRDADRAAGRTLVAAMAAGEPLTRTRLAPIRAGPVAALIPEGFRAFAVASSMPRGSVRPGDRVDLLATFAGGQPHTETVASGVEVLTVLGADGGAGGTALGDPPSVAETGPAQTLVLLVTPDQAEQLAYARAFADLSISVEGPGEEGGEATTAPG